MKSLWLFIILIITSGLFAVDRYALVIGNSNYAIDPLDNTINDAYDVSKSFNDLGYSVTTIIDGNKQEMEVAVTKVSNNLPKDSMIVFYYAGHAAQVENRNYLIPVGEVIANENDLKYRGVNLDWILGSFKSSLCRTNIIILDSCRDNPFKDSTRGGGTRGLSVISTPPSVGVEIKNRAIIYATTDGATADDGDGRNSPFTTAFLKNIGRKNETILDIMTYVTQDVFTSSGGKQEPIMTNALKEKVYFSENIIVETNLSINGGLIITPDEDGDFYINDHFISFIYSGDKKKFLDIDPGEYVLRFESKDHSDIVIIDLEPNKVVPINFYTSIIKPESKILQPLTEDQLDLNRLLLEKETIVDKKISLVKEIKLIENQLQQHGVDKKLRDSRKRTATNSSLLSLLSYVGAGVCSYYAYENYKVYNRAENQSDIDDSRELSTRFVAAAGGSLLFGIINSSISSTKYEQVRGYDLQENLYNNQLKSRRRELSRVEDDFDRVVYKINRIEKK